jgi:DNA sulfur modification protein DndC
MKESTPTTTRKSAFDELGLKGTIDMLCEEIRELYKADDVPWIIGYSGGKDSTATLQLVWLAIQSLPQEKRHKTVHVISTDTLVENPVVAAWVTHSLTKIQQEAERTGITIQPHRLTPRILDTFWVNLIGKGYPAPRHKFRWCTERLKIRPSNDFILRMIKNCGEAILVLGSRKAESQARARNMSKHEAGRVRERLSPNANLPGSTVYTPIETWTNDDVWTFLMQVKNPWGYNNKDLLNMYAGASADGECPLVVDTSTPSCGDSRFGCWVCTLVEQDKSMTAMIQNDAEKEWMEPLLDLRNALDFRMNGTGDEESSDRHLRDFRRMGGHVQIMKSKTGEDYEIPGPYTQAAREDWLRRLLKAQTRVRKNGPEDMKTIQLITLEELQEIRRIWVVEKHEIEDSLPGIYEEATGEKYPGKRLDDNLVLGGDEMEVLKSICGRDTMHYELVRELLSVERQQRVNARRAGLFGQLEKSFKRHFYDSREDAVQTALRHAAAKKSKREASSDSSSPQESVGAEA